MASWQASAVVSAPPDGPADHHRGRAVVVEREIRPPALAAPPTGRCGRRPRPASLRPRVRPSPGPCTWTPPRSASPARAAHGVRRRSSQRDAPACGRRASRRRTGPSAGPAPSRPREARPREAARRGPWPTPAATRLVLARSRPVGRPGRATPTRARAPTPRTSGRTSASRSPDELTTAPGDLRCNMAPPFSTSARRRGRPHAQASGSGRGRAKASQSTRDYTPGARHDSRDDGVGAAVAVRGSGGRPPARPAARLPADARDVAAAVGVSCARVAIRRPGPAGVRRVGARGGRRAAACGRRTFDGRLRGRRDGADRPARAGASGRRGRVDGRVRRVRPAAPARGAALRPRAVGHEGRGRHGRGPAATAAACRTSFSRRALLRSPTRWCPGCSARRAIASAPNWKARSAR